jgi:hypothetical protein
VTCGQRPEPAVHVLAMLADPGRHGVSLVAGPGGVERRLQFGERVLVDREGREPRGDVGMVGGEPVACEHGDAFRVAERAERILPVEQVVATIRRVRLPEGHHDRSLRGHRQVELPEVDDRPEARRGGDGPGQRRTFVPGPELLGAVTEARQLRPVRLRQPGAGPQIEPEASVALLLERSIALPSLADWVGQLDDLPPSPWGSLARRRYAMRARNSRDLRR